jgi:hypothetical protein
MPEFKAIQKTNNKRIKTAFVSGVLRRDAEAIRTGQQQVADNWNLFKDGALKSWLQGHFSVSNNDGGAKLSMRYLMYARFLDLPDPRRRQRQMKREGYHLYNRQIFGVLYGKTLPSIRYGLTDEIREQITNALAQSVGGERNATALITKTLRQG